MSKLAKLGAIVAAVLLIVALYVSWDASNRARDLAEKRDRDAEKALVNNYERAITQCKSDREGKELWDRVDGLLIPDPANADPEVEAAHEAIKAYTGRNTTCSNLPPKPRSLK